MTVRSGGQQFARLVAPTILILCSLTLAACAVPPSAPPSSEAPQADPEQTAPAATPAIGPAAVMTIAAVDVDGLHASVAGFITDDTGDGGSCEYRLSPALAGDPVIVESDPVANVGTTSCGTVQVPIDQLHRGSWLVVLRFESPSLESTLESAPLAMEVP